MQTYLWFSARLSRRTWFLPLNGRGREREHVGKISSRRCLPEEEERHARLGRAPVRVCMQCRSNLSVSSSSIPVQPSTGESWMDMACRECLGRGSRARTKVTCQKGHSCSWDRHTDSRADAIIMRTICLPNGASRWCRSRRCRRSSERMSERRRDGRRTRTSAKGT